jgi:acrylyl-CoA reductase (NADPH)
VGVVEKEAKMFRALVLEKEGDAAVAHLRELEESALPPGDVTVAVEYSTLNYKDGLALSPNGGGIVRTWPHVAGIDFAGTVEASRRCPLQAGRQGGADRLAGGRGALGRLCPEGAGQGGLAGAAARGPDHAAGDGGGDGGVHGDAGGDGAGGAWADPGEGRGAGDGGGGGVGSVAVAILARLGYQVAAVTGRPETEGYLRDLGAARIVPRAELAEVVKRPLESETWAGCVDAVGGAMLARVLGQMKYGGSVAAVGLAGGALPASVIPFLLRG